MRPERASGRRVRIFAITVHAMTSDRERCISAGMDDYVSKPFDRQTLFTAVEHPTGGEAAPLSHLDYSCRVRRSALLNRLSGNTALMIEVIGIFIEDCPALLAAIDDAITRRNPDDFRKAAHALKGTAGNLSAISLFEGAALLERMGAESRMDAAVDAGTSTVRRRTRGPGVPATQVIRREEPAQCVS